MLHRTRRRSFRFRPRSTPRLARIRAFRVAGLKASVSLRSPSLLTPLAPHHAPLSLLESALTRNRAGGWGLIVKHTPDDRRSRPGRDRRFRPHRKGIYSFCESPVTVPPNFETQKHFRPAFPLLAIPYSLLAVPQRTSTLPPPNYGIIPPHRGTPASACATSGRMPFRIRGGFSD